MSPAIDIDREKVADFCRQWRISALWLFGSVLRADFRPDSDVDVLVAFDPGVHYTLLDLARIQEGLETLFGRPVDLLTRPGVERARNTLRSREILDSAEPLYGS